MKIFLQTILFVIISVTLSAQVTKVSVKELDNYGKDYVGKKIKIEAAFDGLEQTWITYLPWVAGAYSSPEGLEHSYLPNEASKWTGFNIIDLKKGETYMFCFARKSEFKILLDSLNQDEPIDIEGTVFDLDNINHAGLLVEKIDVEHKQSNTNAAAVAPNNKVNIDSNDYKLNVSRVIGNSKNNIIQIIIVLFIGLIIGYFVGYKVKKR